MLKKITLICYFFFYSLSVYARTADFYSYFDIIPLPDVQEAVFGPQATSFKTETNSIYNRGYTNRFQMGNSFKTEFSRTIRLYGASEGRIKASYEDDLIALLGLLPEYMYQYVGPVLHETPGMSEKILNLPGIKETKNQFPKDIAKKFKDMPGLESLSPALYFVLMPEFWGEESINSDKKQDTPAVRPKKQPKLPDYLKERIGLSPTRKLIPAKVSDKKSSKTKKASNILSDFQTINPSLTSKLTTQDVKVFASTLDPIVTWGTKDESRILFKLIDGEKALETWEDEQGISLGEDNNLKDIVNPCWRLVQKAYFGGIYTEFANIVAPYGYSPEEWAYTCDKTIKAFRITKATRPMAASIRLYRLGYYDSYIKKLPSRWQKSMYATSAAMIKMYTALKEDIDTVRAQKKEIEDKFLHLRNLLLIEPIIY